jgi:hypothetical protein
MDGAFDAYNAERLRAADTFLLGRKTYDMFRGFWPSVAENASASSTNREISRLMNAIDKLVISNSMDLAQPEPWLNYENSYRTLLFGLSVKKTAGGGIVVDVLGDHDGLHGSGRTGHRGGAVASGVKPAGKTG